MLSPAAYSPQGVRAAVRHRGKINEILPRYPANRWCAAQRGFSERAPYVIVRVKLSEWTMRGFVPRTASAIAWALGGLRLVLLLGCALALAACSKCDIPDLGHWGGPHVCHDGPAQH